MLPRAIPSIKNQSSLMLCNAMWGRPPVCRFPEPLAPWPTMRTVANISRYSVKNKSDLRDKSHLARRCMTMFSTRLSGLASGLMARA